MAWHDIIFYELFPQVFNMSITGTLIILAVICVRFLLKKAPKLFSYALWAVVLFRLLCPISFSLDVSFLNQFDVPVTESGSIEYVPANIVHMEEPGISTPISVVNDVVNERLPQGREQLVADPLEAPVSIITYIWFLGIAALAIYSAVQYVKLRRKLIGATPLRGNIFLADYIDSPFVMGLVFPRIYLPSSLSETEQEYVILHEKHHVKRGDHIIKVLAFAALCIHWFNPFVWLAFVLSGKDMEMSCDEAVVGKMNHDIRAEYATSLLRFATGRKLLVGTPLAFGEGNTKDRVKNVMKYKKPLLWLSVTAGVVIVVAAVVLLANPTNSNEDIHSTENAKIKVGNRNSDGLLPVNTLTPKDAEYISELLANAIWLNGTTDCFEDCVFGLEDGFVLYYHSDCGTINDNKTRRCIRLSEAEQSELNDILAKYVKLGSVEVPMEETASLELPNGAIRLDEEELTWFGEQYFSDPCMSIFHTTNIFLKTDYTSPKEINLFELFTSQLMFFGRSSKSEEEKTLARKLANAEGKDNISVSKITTSEMSDVLKLYTGITLEETHKVGLDKFVYLEEYDAYYLVVLNERPIYRLCSLLDGYRTEEGRVVLLYEDPSLIIDGYSAKYIVTLLKATDGSIPSMSGYYIYSNVPK